MGTLIPNYGKFLMKFQFNSSSWFCLHLQVDLVRAICTDFHYVTLTSKVRKGVT